MDPISIAVIGSVGFVAGLVSQRTSDWWYASLPVLSSTEIITEKQFEMYEIPPPPPSLSSYHSREPSITPTAESLQEIQLRPTGMLFESKPVAIWTPAERKNAMLSEIIQLPTLRPVTTPINLYANTAIHADQIQFERSIQNIRSHLKHVVILK